MALLFTIYITVFAEVSRSTPTGRGLIVVNKTLVGNWTLVVLTQVGLTQRTCVSLGTDTQLSRGIALAIDTLPIEDTLLLSLVVVGVVVTHTLVAIFGGWHVYTPATNTTRACTVMLECLLLAGM